MIEGQKYVGLSVWKQLLLIASMLLSGGLLIPGQAAYAQNNWSRSPFICRAGDGGNGGIANNQSNGAAGAPGGSCVYGNQGGDGAPGGDHGSPGGPGGNAF